MSENLHPAIIEILKFFTDFKTGSYSDVYNQATDLTPDIIRTYLKKAVEMGLLSAAKDYNMSPGRPIFVYKITQKGVDCLRSLIIE